jgi:hypothetical protein
MPERPVCLKCWWALDRTWHHAWNFASPSTKAFLAQGIIEQTQDRLKRREAILDAVFTPLARDVSPPSPGGEGRGEGEQSITNLSGPELC